MFSSKSPSNGGSTFVLVFCPGSCSEMGSKPYMEDKHICIDNLVDHLGALGKFPSPGAFYGVCKLIVFLLHYGTLYVNCWCVLNNLSKFLELLQVFDGHGGTYAALFVRENILRFIVEDVDFPFCAKKAIRNAFLNVDYAFVDAGSLDSSSGTRWVP